MPGQPIEFERFGGMNSRNDPAQLAPEYARSVRNMALGRQVAEKRRGYVKATQSPVWTRALSLDGVKTGILAAKVPENLPASWDDSGGVANRTTLTFQVRLQGIDLASVGETEVPYSLDYNGGHEMPTEIAELINPVFTTDAIPYTVYRRTTTPLGYESADALLWKPAGAANRYDTTANKKFPWLPGNVAAVTAPLAEDARPKMACVFGTGPLREYPLHQRNTSQKVWAGATYATTNKLIKTEKFDDASWVKEGTNAPVAQFTPWLFAPAPNGTFTAQTFTFGLVDSRLRQNVTITTGLTYTGSVWLRIADGAGSVTVQLGFGTVLGTAVVVPDDGKWHRVSSGPIVAPATHDFRIQATGLGVTRVLGLWGASAYLGSTVKAYVAVDGAAGVPASPPDWTYSFFTKAWPEEQPSTIRFPAPPAQVGTANPGGSNVRGGFCDSGDLYLFYVYSPYTGGWHLMFLWEYSDPGTSAAPHAQGMNRMFAFAGWGAAGDNTAAAIIDPTVPHTVTCSFERNNVAATASKLSIWVDDGTTFGVTSAQPNPGPGGTTAGDPSAPLFGLRELSGTPDDASGPVRPAWRGRTMYLGGLPKASNQRGAYGYGEGQSSRQGGTVGVTCPFPGSVAELRLYCGAFASSDLAAGATLAPHDSRTIKRKAGGAVWDYVTAPSSTKYTGCLNIWRLDEESGDVFAPLYLLAGATGTTGYKTGGLTGFAQDWKSFSPIGNGALIAPSALPASSGAMRFNGGSPAFTLQAAKFRKSEGDGQSTNGEPQTSHGLLKPPNQFSWGCIYTVDTAPEPEPASYAGASGELVVPSQTRPAQGEVHTLLQLMSPNKEGKTTTVWGSKYFGVDPLGATQGLAQGFDHPDTVWDGSIPAAGPDFGGTQKPPGHKDLELARVDLVCHRVATAAPAAELTNARRYVFRCDFGRGATLGNYALDPNSATDAGKARQQRGNEKFFRARGDSGTIDAGHRVRPFDVDDDYWFIDKAAGTPFVEGDGTDDDRYCWVTVCDAAGVALSKPADIEGRVYAILSGYAINPKASSSEVTPGKQTLQVWDVTNPLAVFLLNPSTAGGTGVAQTTAESGLSWAASSLFGNSKYALAFGGKIQPQGGEWWIGGTFYPSNNPSLYPHGCSTLGSNADVRNDPTAMVGATGMVFNGCKGRMDGVFVFREQIAPDTALKFFKQWLQASAAWGGYLPQAALDVIGNSLMACWLADLQGGPVIADNVGGMNIGIDESIPLELTTGSTQGAAFNDTITSQLGNVPTYKSLPYTLNRTVSSRMFPDKLRPVRVLNTGRRDSLYTTGEEFTDAVLAAIGTNPEPNNVVPRKETLLAVFGHTGRASQTAVLVVSKTAVMKYDPAGAGSLVRVGALRQHFSELQVVSRDVVGERTILTNGAASPVIVGQDGKPSPDEFLEPPQYAVPEIWARSWLTGSVYGEVIPPVSTWPYAFQIANETSHPQTPSELSIERVDATDGIVWTGEMPSIEHDVPMTGLVKTSGSDIVRWSWFFTYWSEPLQVESQPGRVFFFQNALPLRLTTYGMSGFNTGVDPNPDDPFTGEPNAEGLVLVMRGANPADLTTTNPNGKPQHYNIRVRNIPLSANPNVTHIRVYRTTTNGSTFFLEKEIPVAAGPQAQDGKISTLVGEVPDAVLTQPHIGGIASFVPAGARFTVAFQGRVFYGGFSWAPTRIYGSYSGRPTSVPFFYYIDLDGSGPGPLTGLYADGDRVYAYKEDAVYIGVVREWDVFDFEQAVQGLPFGFEIVQTDAGAVGDRAIASIPEKGIVYAGDSSIMIQSGMQIVRASAPIDGSNRADLDTSKTSDAADASRIVYPFALDNTKRTRWRAHYYAPLRCVLFLGAPADPALVFFPDLMEWAFWTDFSFDDTETISRYNSDIQELWAVRDNRLWKLDVGHSDGIDYSNAALDGTLMVKSDGTRLTGGTIIEVTGDDLGLSMKKSDLPAAYQAMLGPSATSEQRDKDLLRSAYLTVIDPATGLSKSRRPIKFAYYNGDVVHVVLAQAGSGAIVGDQFRVGTIDWHWVSGHSKPGRGRYLVEVLRLDLQKTGVSIAAGSAQLYGDVYVHLKYGTPWPISATSGLPLFTFTGDGRFRNMGAGFRGRGTSFSLGLLGTGAYAPVGLVSGALDVNVLSGRGAMG